MTPTTTRSGTAKVNGTVATLLADEHSVISYDRRGHSRSWATRTPSSASAPGTWGSWTRS